ncbi:MAG: hypothetical protein PHE49_00595 [bacterium]|nr:hypothetical protein [bacterium]
MIKNIFPLLVLTFLSLSCSVFQPELSYEQKIQKCIKENSIIAKSKEYKVTPYGGFIPIFYSIPKWLSEDITYFVEYTNDSLSYLLRLKEDTMTSYQTRQASEIIESEGNSSIIKYNLKTGEKNILISVPCSSSTIIDYTISPDGEKLIYSTINIPANIMFYGLGPSIFVDKEEVWNDKKNWYNETYVSNFLKKPVCTVFMKDIKHNSFIKKLWEENTLYWNLKFNAKGNKLSFENGKYVLKRDSVGNDCREGIITGDTYLDIITDSAFLTNMYDLDSLIKLPTGNNMGFSNDDSKIFIVNSISDTQILCSVDTLNKNFKVLISDFKCSPYTPIGDNSVQNIIRPYFMPTTYLSNQHPEVLVYPETSAQHIEGIIFYNIKTQKKDTFSLFNSKERNFNLTYAISPDGKRIAILTNITNYILGEKNMYIYDCSKDIEQILEKIK